MIRSSALLTAVAMVLLVVGVSAANLGLIYLSVAVSIVAAVTLAAGVLLRRRELFGEAGAAPEAVRPGSAAAGRARPAPVPSTAGDRTRRGGRPEARQDDGEQRGDLAARLRKATSGAVADAGSRLWPGAIAAKAGPPAARRGGDHSAGRGAGRGRTARSTSGRAPVVRDQRAREPARGDRAGRDRDQAAVWPDREYAARERDRAAEPGRDREQAGRGPDKYQVAAEQHAEAFRLPPPAERARARAEALGHGASGDEFWDRASEEVSEPVPWDRGAIPHPSGPPGEEQAPGEELGDAAAEPAWNRVVPRYVEDLARPGGQDREPEHELARADEPGGPDAWSAWASTPPTAAGRDEPDRADEPVSGVAESAAAASAVPGETGADGAAAGEADDTAGSDTDAAASLDDEVTAVPGIPRYHRRGCILIRFLSDDDLETTTRREAEAAGSVPCKACQPDKPVSAG